MTSGMRLVSLLVAAAVLRLPAAAAECPGPESARIRRVVDGDTVAVLWRGRPDKLRLLRINTPEVDQVGYREATVSLEQLLAGGELTFTFEDGVAERDTTASRRLLAYVCAGDVNVNVEQVRRGWSRYWTKFGRGRLVPAFEAAEGSARSAGRGLWPWWKSRGR